MGDCLVRTESRFKAFVFDGAKDQLVQVRVSWYLVGKVNRDGFGDFVQPFQESMLGK